MKHMLKAQKKCSECFFVWDAIIAWRDHIYKSEFMNCTKSNYLTSMLKLIEAGVIDVYLNLKKIDACFIKEARQKIEFNPNWSKSIKIARKSCLNSFYNFIQSDFDHRTYPHRRHPKPNEIRYTLSNEARDIKHILSSVKEKALITDIPRDVLCEALSKINARDAYIVFLMMITGQPLESILDIRKENLRPPYIEVKGVSEYIPERIRKALEELCKDSKVYLFETAKCKKICRTQVTRNLKKAGRVIGLNFDLTSKILHGYVCEDIIKDKRSVIEKGLGI